MRWVKFLDWEYKPKWDQLHNKKKKDYIVNNKKMKMQSSRMSTKQ